MDRLSSDQNSASDQERSGTGSQPPPERESRHSWPPVSYVGGEGARKPIAIAIVTTLAVAAGAWLLPDSFAANSVALIFFGATYFLVIRSDDLSLIRNFGLSLGGLAEPIPIDWRRVLRDTAHAAAWALAASALVFPAFWLGYVFWWEPAEAFAPRFSSPAFDVVLGHLLVIALPEEAFYRGYLQTALDRASQPRWRLWGAQLGPSTLIVSALFAIGHFMTEPNPARLAVFFPSLAFCWLRAKTGGIGAAVFFHAACNLFASFLGHSYGLLS